MSGDNQEVMAAAQCYKICQKAQPVVMGMFALNRQRLVNELKKQNPRSVVLLQGGVAINHYNTDTEYTFRQESYFHWTFGVREPGFWGIVDVGSLKSYLFMPKLPESYAIWMGAIEKPHDVKEKYGVDEVHYIDQIPTILGSIKAESVLVLKGENTDSQLVLSPPEVPDKDKFDVDEEILYPVMTELRVIKTNFEIDLLRYANKISSEAHKFVMKRVKPEMYEFQAEALFLNYIYFVGGCRTAAYTCICGSGQNSSILHYGHAAAPNNKQIMDGDMCLFDMGGSYYGYSADITVSYPVNGHFTDKQKIIYTAVLNARNAVLEGIKPGVAWTDLHRLAQEEVLKHLVEHGLLKGRVSDMLTDGLGSVFQPHGMGHLLGIDVHDVGGFTNSTPERPSEPGFMGLRTGRKLVPGMVLTVEPGCYFIDKLLDDAAKDKNLRDYLCPEVLKEYKGFGGVRLEDDILVTEDGHENLTDVPRTIEEVEKILSEKVSVKVENPESGEPNDKTNYGNGLKLDLSSSYSILPA